MSVSPGDDINTKHRRRSPRLHATRRAVKTPIDSVWSEAPASRAALYINYTRCTLQTRSSAVAERPRDASCLFVVSFDDSTMPRVHF